MLYEAELGKKIRELREKEGLTIAKLAEMANVNAVHLSYIEKGLRVPSEDLIARITSILGKDENEKAKNRKECLLLLAKIKAPEEIKDVLQIGESFLTQKGSMPNVFMERLKEDIESQYVKPELFWRSVGVDNKTAEEIMQNRLILPRELVIRIAMKLNQSVDKYLLLAGYVPDEFKMLADKENIVEIIRSFASFSSEEIDQIISAMQSVLKLVKRK